MATESITYPLTSLIPTNVIINDGAAVSTFSNLSLQLNSGADGVVCNVNASGLSFDATGSLQTYLTTNELSLGGVRGSAGLICSADNSFLQTSSAFQAAAIADQVSSLGAAGQVLSAGSGGNSLLWVDLAVVVTPSLQDVVNVSGVISNGVAIVYDASGTTTLVDKSLTIETAVSTVEMTDAGLSVVDSTVPSALISANYSASSAVFSNGADVLTISSLGTSLALSTPKTAVQSVTISGYLPRSKSVV